MSGRSARGIGMPRCAHSRSRSGPLPAVCYQPPTFLVCVTGASAFSVFPCMLSECGYSRCFGCRECLSAVCQASKLGDSLEDRYPSFDFEKIKQGQAQLGWAGELEQAAAQVGEQWQPFMTVATAIEAGLYKT